MVTTDSDGLVKNFDEFQVSATRKHFLRLVLSSLASYAVKQPNNLAGKAMEPAGSATPTRQSEQSERSARSTDVLFKDPTAIRGPPLLNYNLWDRKLAIAICWALILLDSMVLAVVLYYPLTYASKLQPWEVMTVVTCLVGVISLVQFFWRTWVLVRRDNSCRPIGGSRWQMDCFQWIYLAGVVLVTVELVIGTIPDDPIMGLCSMPLASILFLAAGCDLIATIGYFLRLRSPIRISSLPRGEFFRPGSYTMIEDIVAVDGHGKLDYRVALDLRYRSSQEFQSLLAKMSLFWSIPALIVGAGVTAAVWTTPDPVAFGIGWCVPMLWVIVWLVLTIPICQVMLKNEQEAWVLRELAAS